MKAIVPTQAALDDVPFNSGTYSVLKIPGLYLRARAHSKSFFVQRRVSGTLVKKTLGDLPMKVAKDRAMRVYSGIKVKPDPRGVVTLGKAFDSFMADNKLAASTRRLYTYLFERHFSHWRNRSLAAIGEDRSGLREFHRYVKTHAEKTSNSPSTGNSVMTLFRAIYTDTRALHPELPEIPPGVIKLDAIKSRNIALTADGLREWYAIVRELPTMKRVWWLTVLFSGGRRGSVEPLKWSDFDFEKKTLHFRIAKGDKPYTIPMSDPLVKVITDYRAVAPPTEYLFPSSRNDRGFIVDHIIGTGLKGPHRLRHTYKTWGLALHFADIDIKILQGHSLGGGASSGYVTVSHLLEPLRPVTNAISAQYLKILGVDHV